LTRRPDAVSGAGVGAIPCAPSRFPAGGLGRERDGAAIGPGTVMIWSIGKGKLDSRRADLRADLTAEVTKGVVADD
jgi:hypothetical protein